MYIIQTKKRRRNCEQQRRNDTVRLSSDNIRLRQSQNRKSTNTELNVENSFTVLLFLFFILFTFLSLFVSTCLVEWRHEQKMSVNHLDFAVYSILFVCVCAVVVVAFAFDFVPNKMNPSIRFVKL